MTMIERIHNDHFMMKNYQSFSKMQDKLLSFLQKVEEGMPDASWKQKYYVTTFREIVTYKFTDKLQIITEKALNTAANTLYVANQYPNRLMYYYPELVMDTMLKNHLEKVIKINKNHTESLTKVKT